MTRFQDSVKEIASDLLNIEVNTVLSAGLTAEKMPKPRRALMQIAEDFEVFLRAAARKANAPLDPEDDFLDAAERADGKIELKANGETFRKLRKWGQKIQRSEAADAVTMEDRIVIQRIRRGCEQIEAILERFEAPGGGTEPPAEPDLMPSEIMAIRKIWELGIEQVLMQSVIQIDGDIVTRIRLGHETDKHKVIHELHGAAVDLSLGHWRFLVEALTGFLSSAIAQLFNRRP